VILDRRKQNYFEKSDVMDFMNQNGVRYEPIAIDESYDEFDCVRY